MGSIDQLIQRVRNAASVMDGVTGDYDDLETALQSGDMAEAVEMAGDLSSNAASYARDVAAIHRDVAAAAAR